MQYSSSKAHLEVVKENVAYALDRDKNYRQLSQIQHILVKKSRTD